METMVMVMVMMERQSNLVYVGNNPTILNPKLWRVFRDLFLEGKSLKRIHLGRQRKSENKNGNEEGKSWIERWLEVKENKGRKRAGTNGKEVDSHTVISPSLLPFYCLIHRSKAWKEGEHTLSAIGTSFGSVKIFPHLFLPPSLLSFFLSLNLWNSTLSSLFFFLLLLSHPHNFWFKNHLRNKERERLEVKKLENFTLILTTNQRRFHSKAHSWS